MHMNIGMWVGIVLVAPAMSACSSVPSTDMGAGYFDSGQYELAAEQWIQPANDGDPVAQHNLGLLAREGLGRKQDLNAAAAWYLKSAQQDYVPAMVSLAEVQVMLGQEKPAESWLTLAARWGSQEACDLLEARGLAVPEPDLYTAASQELQLEKMRATGDMLRPPIRKMNAPRADDNP